MRHASSSRRSLLRHLRYGRRGGRSLDRPGAPPAQLEETVAFLGNLPIFQSLSREGLTRLAENMELRSFSEGPILRENGSARGLHIIKSGAAKVTKSSEAGGTEAVLAILKPGDSFGEIGLIDDMPASADVSAMQPVECYTLGRDVFFTVLDEHPEIARGMLQVLAGMVRNADEWVARAI